MCCGLQRSGSTAQFNIVRHLFSIKGVQPYTSFITGYNQNDKSLVHIIKSHIVPPLLLQQMDEKRPTGIELLTTHRDIRDAAASAVRMGWAPNNQNIANYAKEILARYKPSARHAIHNMRYEDFQSNPGNTVQDIATALDIELSAQENTAILDHLETGNDSDKLDNETLLHPNHCGTGEIGTYKEQLSQEAITAIEDNCGDWLREHNYI
tara:strand:+ start:932 stop:1558 length:627 start_codon:yes stop_codon:yes gene_type:complete